MKTNLTTLFFLYTSLLFAQAPFNANDSIPPYEGPFLYGANMGYFPMWENEELADIAAGNSHRGVSGVGVKSLRPLVPEHFLEQYGYDYLLPDFSHYDTIGVKDNTIMIGYPSNDHLDPNFYCDDSQSRMFDNMYTDIWDDGTDGTPYNDENHYAAYLHKVVTKYKDYVKFYEVWNEPDFDYGTWGWRPSGQDGNWWDNDPDPCHYALRAPVQHYVRLLRISYEVIKTVDSTAYVAVGGLGYESFLDAVLRNTDNPDGGTETADYPLYGGAYFDVLSFHSYPHIDGSLRAWNNDTQEFDYFRHSDAAVNGLLEKKQAFEEVLHDYGYDGEIYPEKIAIVTECNVPRKEFGEYFGSNEGQKNFTLKALVTAQKNKIKQFYVFNLAERESYEEATSSTKLMGLYEDLNPVGPYEQTLLDAGIAYKTTSDLLFGLLYDSDQTDLMALNDSLDGGAFLDTTSGFYTYVLWAKTQEDKVEEVADTFSFPAPMGIIDLELKDWAFTENKIIDTIGSTMIPVSGTPVFLRDFTNTALPIELLSFVALRQDEEVLLKWITLTEENNDYFELEHSTDGRNFTSIGVVRGDGNSTLSQSYKFIHSKPTNGKNYYRLKQVDLDLKFSYSEIRVVDIKLVGCISFKPTVSNSEILIEMDEELSASMEVKIYDMNGQLVLESIVRKGQQSSNIDIRNFPNGHYAIKCFHTSGIITGRFVKTE